MFQLKRSFSLVAGLAAGCRAPRSVLAVDARRCSRPATRRRRRSGSVGIDEHPEAVAAVEVLPARVGDAARVRRVADPASCCPAGRRRPGTGPCRRRSRGRTARPAGCRAFHQRLPPSYEIHRPPSSPPITCLRVRRDRSRRRASRRASRRRVAAKLLPPSSLTMRPQVGLEDAVRVRRIDDEAREVERPPDHHLAVVARLPGRAAVVGAIERRLASTR